MAAFNQARSPADIAGRGLRRLKQLGSHMASRRRRAGPGWRNYSIAGLTADQASLGTIWNHSTWR